MGAEIQTNIDFNAAIQTLTGEFSNNAQKNTSNEQTLIIKTAATEALIQADNGDYDITSAELARARALLPTTFAHVKKTSTQCKAWKTPLISCMANYTRTINEGKGKSPLLSLSETEFDRRVLQVDTLAIVYIGAAWCLPCKRLKPILEEVSREYLGRMVFYEMDYDLLSGPFKDMQSIASIPMIIVFDRGTAISKLEGYDVSSLKELEASEKPSTRKKNRSLINALLQRTKLWLLQAP